MHVHVHVSLLWCLVCLPVKWGEAELSCWLQHVSTAPQSEKSLVVAGQIVHEFWIDPFGFYELKIAFATSRSSERHGGYSLEGPPCSAAFWVQQREGRVDKHVLCLIRPETYSSIKDMASIMSHCLQTRVSGKLISQADKRNGKGLRSNDNQCNNKRGDTLSDSWDTAYQPECTSSVRGIHTSAAVRQLLIYPSTPAADLRGRKPFGVTKQFVGTGSNKSAKRRRVRSDSYVWNQHFPTLLTIIASMYPSILQLGPKWRLTIVVDVKNQGFGHFSGCDWCFLKWNSGSWVTSLSL